MPTSSREVATPVGAAQFGERSRPFTAPACPRGRSCCLDTARDPLHGRRGETGHDSPQTHSESGSAQAAYGEASWGGWEAAGLWPRRSEIPIAAIQTKKPTKPMNVMPSITSEVGAKAPSQPAKNATTKPSQPIQRPTTRVFKAA